MIDLDGDAGRDFKGLDAREAQEALEEEMNASVEQVETEEEDMAPVDASSEAEEASSDDEAADDTDEDVEATAEVATEDSVEEADAQEVDAPSAAEENAEAEDNAEAGETSEVEAEEEQEAAPEWSEEERLEHERMVEALLFAAAEPLDQKSIVDRLPAGADIAAALEAITARYEGRGVELRRVEKKWRFVTAADVSHVLDKEKVEPRKLSRAALETLAIIAYHQPCTRADIEDVRGVAVSKGSLDQLLEIGWVKLRGKRRDVPGQPILYGTTQDFIEHFGLESIQDLPGLSDLKAAGLLDARLPPGFAVPNPADADELEEGEEAAETEFVQDFLGEEEAESAES